MNKKKNKKIIYLITGLAVVLLSIFLIVSIKDGASVSSVNNKENKSELVGALYAEEKYFDFGDISMKNGNVSREFKIENKGEGPVVINKVYTSCMCTSAFIIDETGKKRGPFSMPGHGGGPAKTNIEVPAGKSAVIEAVFDPAAHGPAGVGLAERSVYIETNSPMSPRLEFSFKAAVSR